MNNLLPNTSSVVEDLLKEYEVKVEAIRDEVKDLKSLLMECQSPDSRESTPSKSKGDHGKSPKPKPLSQRNSLPSSNQGQKNSRNILPLERMPEHKSGNSGSYKLKDLVNKVKDKNLKECSERIDDYIELRETPDKRTELEKQRFLLALDNKWEEDFKTFEIFDPDLGADLLKSIAALRSSEPKPSGSFYELKKKVKNVEQKSGNTEQHLLNEQKKIDLAVCSDLSSIDFNELRSKENKSAAVALYKTVSALTNIKNPKPGIVFKKMILQ